MKYKLSLNANYLVYFFLLLGLYHYKIKHYPYWNLVAFKEETYFDLSLQRLLVAILIFLVDLYFLLKVKRGKLSYAVLSFFFLLLTIPSLIAFTSQNMYQTKLMAYHQLLFFGVLMFSKIKMDFSKIPVLNKKQSLYVLFGLITLGMIPYLVVYGPHLNIKNLFFLDVYETRRSISGVSNPYFGYTYSLFTKILVPLFLIFALELKNKVMTFIAILYLILFYLFGAHKTVYASIIVIFVFYSLNYSSAISKIVTWSNFLIVICFAFALIGIDQPWIYSFRRVHFIPTLLDITYLDFFEHNPIFWSESVLGAFIRYPFETTHAHLIGEAYFNSPGMDANNGLISDGYMNFGTWGVVINVFIVACYSMILDSMKVAPKYFGLFVLMLFSFMSSSTPTVMLTHGALALLVISMFILNRSGLSTEH